MGRGYLISTYCCTLEHNLDELEILFVLYFEGSQHFLSLSHVREETERWRVEYNTIRPHQSLGDVSPIEFLTHRGHAEIASNGWY